jgi:hypothetical protein
MRVFSSVGFLIPIALVGVLIYYRRPFLQAVDVATTDR